MILKNILFIVIFFICSCSNIEFVIKKDNQKNQLINNVALVSDTGVEGVFLRELFALFGNKTQDHEYILVVKFSETKENRIVKKNQVAERIDYTLTATYNLYYKTQECLIGSKKINTRFSFTPKSAGYNFATDRSFEKLYTNSVKKNIQNFVSLAPFETTCLQ